MLCGIHLFLLNMEATISSSCAHYSRALLLVWDSTGMQFILKVLWRSLLEKPLLYIKSQTTIICIKLWLLVVYGSASKYHFVPYEQQEQTSICSNLELEANHGQCSEQSAGIH